MKVARSIIVVLFFSAALCPAARAQVRVVAQVDTSKDIYAGQSFTYMVIIDGDNKPGQVDVSALAKYNPRSTGGRDITSTTIINNKVSHSKRYVMTYSLTAAEPGRIELPPVTVVHNGKTYRTNPVSVNILRPGTTDQLDFEVRLSEQRCYVGQPVLMTVNFYVAAGADVGDFQFNIPALSGDSFYIEDPAETDPQAKMYRLRMGLPVAITQYRVRHKGRDFTRVSFSKVLIPRRAGRIDMGTPSVTAALAVGRARSRDSFFDDFFGSRKQYRRFAVSAEPMVLTVLPLPEEGKPDGFYGLVGRYTIEAIAAPTKVNVGDPITLTIRIGGNSYLKPVQWPRLDEIPELARNFKIPEEMASPTIEDGCKVFTQTIRANNDKVTRIPPIGLPVFDPEMGAYTVVETAPIKLEVAPTRILTNADLQGLDVKPVNRQVQAIKKGLSANYEGPDVLVNQSFSPLAAAISPAYVWLWSVPLAALLASVALKFASRTNPEKAARRRRRQAAPRAIRQLKAVAEAPQQQRREMLVSALKQYIGERFDRVAGSLTADDCERAIAQATGEAATARRFSGLLATCEAGRYAPTQAEIGPDQIEEAIALIRAVEKGAAK